MGSRAIDMMEDAEAHGSGNSPAEFARQSGLFGEQQYAQVVDMARHLQGTGANILTNAFASIRRTRAQPARSLECSARPTSPRRPRPSALR